MAYIDVDVLIEQLNTSKEYQEKYASFREVKMTEFFIKCVKEQPTVDVKEVKHGEWLYNRGQAPGEPLYYCSLCIDGGSDWGKDNFCPHCGAKMDGGNK